MKKFLLTTIGLSLAFVGCESANNPTNNEIEEIRDFAVTGSGNSYQGPLFDSCFLADPYEIVVIGKLLANQMVSKDPACDVVDHYPWSSFDWTDLAIVGSTSDEVKVGDNITALVHDLKFTSNSIEGAENYILVSLRKVEGKWVQSLKPSFSVLQTTDPKDDFPIPDPAIHFPTNWAELKSTVLANQADYAKLCPTSEVLTGAEFEAKVLDQDLYKDGCSTRTVAPEAKCAGVDCDPSDGDDSHDGY